MGGKPVTYPASKENFQDICSEHPYQAGSENNHAFIDSVRNHSCGGGDPKYKYCRVEGIHKIPGQENLYVISFPEFKYLLSFIVHFYFLEEKEKYSHRHKENTTRYSNFCFVGNKAIEKLCEYIADQQESDITCRYTEDKSETAAVAVVQALLDNGKQDRAYRNAQQQTKSESFKHDLQHNREKTFGKIIEDRRPGRSNWSK